MNILLINHYAGSPVHGMEFRPYYLAREWINLGHKVKIIAASHSHIRSHQPELNGFNVKDELLDGIEYRWFKTPKYSKNGFGRILNILVFLFVLFFNSRKIAAEFKPDVVIASSTYPMDIWPAKWIAKLANCKLLYEVHDLWPLSPIELGGMSKFHPFIILVQCAEDFAYKSADKVVSMLPLTLPYMVSRGLDPVKWSYVPNGVHLSEWNSLQDLPIDIQNKLHSLKSSNLPILCYAGTHGLANGLDFLLDAAALLKNQAWIVLVGSGPERKRLLKRSMDMGLTNLLMFDPIPKSSIPSLLNMIDIAYIGLLPQPLFRFGISPNKLFDYMMAGKPIIQAIDSGNDLVSKIGCGITIKPGDPTAIANAVAELSVLNSTSRAMMGARGRQFVCNFRNYPFLAKVFLDSINGVSSNCEVL